MQAENGAAVFVWGKWLPYHFTRVQACVGPFREAGLRVLGVQYSDISTDYKIQSSAANAGFDFLDLRLGRHETDFQPLRIVKHWPAALRRHNVRVAFLPSYWDWSVTMGVLCRLHGCKVIMMNESHAGTERATGWKKWIKRQIVCQFDAALVGGTTHKRHFASLGLPEDKIFTGYDAVDNNFFAARADEIRAWAKKSIQCSVDSSQGREAQPSGLAGAVAALGLPKRYFLSLGRMVEKKNLATLIAAYRRYCDEWRVASDEGQAVESGRSQETVDRSQPEGPANRLPPATRNGLPALVFVGSGELEAALEAQARALGLTVVDRRPSAVAPVSSPANQATGGEDTAATRAEHCKLSTANSVEQHGAVLFYGFRQIEENPVFYALAEAFVLPSLYEEWGLVVNEAMAAGLPVIVSRTAGCAEDLVPEAPASRSSQLAAGRIQPESPATTDDCKQQTANSLEQRSNGFVFDPNSVEALAEALRRMAESEERRAEMGRRSREIVEQFSCENFARQALAAALAASRRRSD